MKDYLTQQFMSLIPALIRQLQAGLHEFIASLVCIASVFFSYFLLCGEVVAVVDDDDGSGSGGGFSKYDFSV